ncbi:MAG: hypothetical protein WDO16_14130 [Bacteroidota bacterium]
MPVTNSKICVLFATLIVLFLTGCANENNPENENSKNDTMKTTTLEKEPGCKLLLKDQQAACLLMTAVQAAFRYYSYILLAAVLHNGKTS